MTKENVKDYLPAVEALRDGELQVKNMTGEWNNVDMVYFDLPPDHYRRRPKPRDLWVIETFDGNHEGFAYASPEKANGAAIHYSIKKPPVHYREVLP